MYEKYFAFTSYCLTRIYIVVNCGVMELFRNGSIRPQITSNYVILVEILAFLEQVTAEKTDNANLSN